MAEQLFIDKAKAYLELCYRELNKEDLLEERWQVVKNSINETGTYELLNSELDYGTKVAWRNSNKCIGRLFWRSMEVLDKRTLETADEDFDALFEHIDFATNGGNIRSTITVFNTHTGIRLWNPQLLGFAGYVQEDGSIIGNSKNVEFTQHCIDLGWEPKMGQFDIFIQSTGANGLLVFFYLIYKCCSRIIGSQCHYSTNDGLEITLADPDEHVDLQEINKFF